MADFCRLRGQLAIEAMMQTDRRFWARLRGSVEIGSDGVVDVLVVNDYQIIVQGLAAMLEPHAGRLRVREEALIGDEIEADLIDVALFDTYGRVGVAEAALRTLASDPSIRHVAIFSLDFTRPLIDMATELGIRAFISKGLDAPVIAEALVLAGSGAAVDQRAAGAVAPYRNARDWPGRSDGLTERESQTLVLLAEGLTNQQIGEALFVNVSTVKARLKRVYRKLRVTNRAQATAYAVASGAFDRYQPAATALSTDATDIITKPPVESPPTPAAPHASSAGEA